MRASDPAFRVDQRVGAEPLDRRRGRQDGSRTPAGSRRTCGPGPLRPWRFFAEPIRHRRASRSASRCGRANRADLCRLRPASRRGDGYQSLDLQRDALRAAGVNDAVNLYHDFASGLRDDRPGLDSCLRVLRKGDVLMVWKLDRLGRNLAHLVVGVRSAPPGRRAPAGPRRGPTDPARCLTRGRPARVRHLRGAGRVRAGADPRTHRGRAQGRTGPWSQGREEVRAVAKAQVRLAQVGMAHRDTSVSALCRELGIRPVNALPVRRPATAPAAQLPARPMLTSPSGPVAGQPRLGA